MKATVNFLIFPQANHPALMATRQLTNVASMWFLSLCEEILSNPGFIASYGIIIVNNGFRTCEKTSDTWESLQAHTLSRYCPGGTGQERKL